MVALDWTLIPHHLPLKEPLRTAKGPICERQVLLLRVRDERAEGWGEASPLADFGGEALEVCRSALAAIPPAPRAALDYAQAISNAAPCAAAAIRGALADHQARVRGLPLATQLAAAHGLRPATRLRCSALLPRPDPELALSAQAQGFKAIKWKSCGDPGADAIDAQALRAALGPNIRLRIDANGSWTQSATLAFAEAVRHIDLDYVEQPLASGEEAHLAQFTSAKLRIALDESLASLPRIAQMLEFCWAEVLVIKYQWLGGYPALRQILNWAKARHPRRVVLSSTIDSAVGRAHAFHAAAALGLDQEAHGLATAGLLAHDVAEDPVIGGHWQLPSAAGIGFNPQL